MFVYLQVLA